MAKQKEQSTEVRMLVIEQRRGGGSMSIFSDKKELRAVNAHYSTMLIGEGHIGRNGEKEQSRRKSRKECKQAKKSK